MIGRFVTRVRNLERSQPLPGDQDAFLERLKRARQRVADLMTDDEWNRSQTPEAIADDTARRARLAEITSMARRGRKPLLADMLRAARS